MSMDKEFERLQAAGVDAREKKMPDLDAIHDPAYEVPSSPAGYDDKVPPLLKRLWDLTHSEGASRGVDAERRRERLEQVIVASISEHELSAAETRGRRGLLGRSVKLEGKVETVDVRIRAALKELGTEDERRQFLRGQVAGALERLEAQGVSREECTDLVVPALRALNETTAVLTIARAAVGYLWHAPTEEHSVGLGITMLNLAQVLYQGAAFEDAMLAYHLALAGLTATTARETEQKHASPISVAAGAVALAMAIHEQQQPRDVAERRAVAVAGVQRRLKYVSAATVEVLKFDGPDPAELLRVLGLRDDEAAVRATLIVDVGNLPSAMAFDGMAAAALQMSAGAVMAGSDLRELTTTMLFNAGVELARVERRGTTIAELVVNLLGLRWAIRTRRSFTDGSGLSCATNLLSTFGEWRELRGSLPQTMTELAALLGAVPSTFGISVWESDAVARIASTLNMLDIAPAPAVHGAQLLDAIEAVATAVALDPLGLPVQDADEFIFTAMLVRAALDDVGAPMDAVDTLVTSLLAARVNPTATVLESYRPLVTGEPAGIGKGPLVEAGIVTQSTWNEVASRLVVPHTSLAPTLREV